MFFDIGSFSEKKYPIPKQIGTIIYQHIKFSSYYIRFS
jgi:hypothetical protein